MANSFSRRRIVVLVGLAALLSATSMLSGKVRVEPPRMPEFDFAKLSPCFVVDVKSEMSAAFEIEGRKQKRELAGLLPTEKKAGAGNDYLKNLLKGEQVYLVEAKTGGTSAAYVFRYPDGLFVNLEMIRLGYAQCDRSAPHEYSEIFAYYEAAARKLGKGDWGANAKSTQKETKRETTPQKQKTSKRETKQAETMTVYVTKNGKCYHKAGCQHLRGGGRPMSLSEAKLKGYRPCKRCKPDG